jgi:hypothetical protein
MKKLIALVSGMALCMLFITGCATSMPVGTLYTQLQLPVATNPDTAGAKKGIAESKSYLSLIATGDSSIHAAMENGGIKKVSHIDWEVENILGLMGTYRTIVYGE